MVDGDGVSAHTLGEILNVRPFCVYPNCNQSARMFGVKCSLLDVPKTSLSRFVVVTVTTVIWFKKECDSIHMKNTSLCGYVVT